LERIKQENLIKSDLKGIEGITVREEQLILEAGCLEKDRLLWTNKIAYELGKEPNEITLAELENYFPVLQGVRSNLDRVIGQLREYHEINNKLLQQAMRMVEFTLGLFTLRESNTYTHPNRVDNENYRLLHLLDRRA
jgi:hypothetical protein